jgi:hypothetical protein
MVFEINSKPALGFVSLPLDDRSGGTWTLTTFLWKVSGDRSNRRPPRQILDNPEYSARVVSAKR